MTELSDDLADALTRHKWPGVIIYDPKDGPPCESEAMAGILVYLPEIDELPTKGATNE